MIKSILCYIVEFMEEIMKKIITLACAVLLISAIFTGCSTSNNDEVKTTEPSSTVSNKVSSKIADKEQARLGNLKDFLKYRSITLDEKVLRFYLDNQQMEYVGFRIVDEKDLNNIAPYSTVEDILYKSDTGLTAYVSMINNTQDNVDYKKCKYYKLRIVKGDCKDVVMHLPNKISWTDTVETVKKAYGNPIEETTNDNGDTVLKYGEKSERTREGYTLELILSKDGITELTIEFYTLK